MSSVTATTFSTIYPQLATALHVCIECRRGSRGVFIKELARTISVEVAVSLCCHGNTLPGSLVVVVTQMMS